MPTKNQHPAPKEDDGDLPTNEHKDAIVQTRVPATSKAKAIARAKKEKRTLSEILRSWIILFGEGEAAPPVPVANERAPQRPSKRKKQKPESETADENEGSNGSTPPKD